MHTTLWRLSQVLLSGREAGGKGQGSVPHGIGNGARVHTGTMPLGLAEAPRGLRVAGRGDLCSVFVC